ncbi:MAG: cyclic beta 1-2 glucan synthetase, partial [Planctomycetes bacterium]|nr:cyclic beta 1-2 glucan synthetase [Planctomycetota bacterium]
MQLPAIPEKLGRIFTWRRTETVGGPSSEDELPLRAELYSLEQLERHARALAASDRLLQGSAPELLHARLEENETLLVETHELVMAAANRKRRIPPAAEWLLDNFYLIEEQIRTARRHLPKSYSRQLPRLANGPAAHLPRAYGISLELIAHGDGRVDVDSLNAFIAAYQTIEPLQIGELWAIPIMLRLALIENLRRVAARVASGRLAQDLADDWAEKMVQVVEQNPSDLILVLADMARANPALSGAFLAELTRRLQGQSPHFAFANSWLEHRLSEQGLTIEHLVVTEGRDQAADQISMGNSISSLRFLCSNDWRTFVEQHSRVEQILRGDPTGAYALSDFATRDRCRHAIEKVARCSPLTEIEVARQAQQLAYTAAAERPHDRTAHVGYYLIDEGRAQLECLTQVRLTIPNAAARLGRRIPLFLYLGSITLLTALASSSLLYALSQHGTNGFILALLLIPTLLSASYLGVGITNWLATLLVKSRPLPRLDFSEGIPPEHRTLVVVPTMLTSAAGVEELLEGLEVRYLANVDDHLHFALLTDFLDAPTETLPNDDYLLRLLSTGVERLCRKYAGERSDIFFLFHRSRRWNSHDAVWMGFERKRGKLADLNAFLRGAHDRFSHIVGDTTALHEVRYVVTLDTDTQLPRDAARELAGALAHPLNRPVWDSTLRRVVAGYGILQPRVGVCLPSARRSWYVRIFGGDAGIDPYTRVISNVYQDLFCEGTFVGKAIYDVDAFEQSCGEFPENAILSHDLLESAHARSGLISDVLLYEEFPASYAADVSRKHRWIRGDWQIAWWLLPWVPRLAAQRCENPISALSWWKIFDNLRRSVVPLGMLTLLLLAWLGVASPWNALAPLFVLAVVGTLPVLTFLLNLVHKPTDRLWTQHVRDLTVAFGKQIADCCFTLILLPYEAYVNGDAISRTLVRVLITKHKLLEWKTASESERSAGRDLAGFVKTMRFAPLLSLFSLALLTLVNPGSLTSATPFLALWCVSPGLAWWLSRELSPAPVRLSEEQRQFLGMLSRRTWRFFEQYVTAEDHWLAPDNVQLHPMPVIATRTSPTNIGVALLADLAACDFGYCSPGRLLERVQQTFGTLSRMERYAGHFYNWYDTRSLLPLPPFYVSTVDSGNLAASFMVLRSGLNEMVDAKILPARLFAGIRDTLRILQDESRECNGGGPTRGQPLVPVAILHKIERLIDELAVQPQSLKASLTLLAQLTEVAQEIAAASGATQELQGWADAFFRMCVEQRDEQLQLAGWAEYSPLPDPFWHSDVPGLQSRLDDLQPRLLLLEKVPTLRELASWQTLLLPTLDDVLTFLSVEGHDPQHA